MMNESQREITILVNKFICMLPTIVGTIFIPMYKKYVRLKLEGKSLSFESSSSFTTATATRLPSYNTRTLLLTTMKSFILASLLTSAAAFAPSQQAKAASALNSETRPDLWTPATSYENEVGAIAPLGFFDPLGLVKDESQEKFDHLREVEIRHGRCAMLAVAGWLTTAAGIRLPGMEDTPFGFKALLMEGMPMEVRGTVPLTLMTVFFLTVFMQDSTGDNAFPGDYRNGLIDFGWDKQTEEWQTRKRSIELNNGRAAQMGILGIMVHEQLGNLNDVGLPQP